MDGEYAKLVAELEAKPREDLYGELLSREKQVLETVNRVIDHERRKRIDKQSWLEMPLQELARVTALRVGTLAKELMEADTIEAAVDVVRKDTFAMLSVGVVLVVVALVVFLAMTAY